MGKEKNSQIIALVALVVAVVGLSVGFAAFSSQLVINSKAEVDPENTFSVRLSSTATSFTSGTVVADRTLDTVSAQGYEGDKSYGGDATINDEGTELTNIKAYFTKPGQSVTYTFYAVNGVDYDAYLDSVVFTPAVGDKCTIPVGSEVTKALMDKACDDIKISIKVGSETNYWTDADDLSDIKNHKIVASASDAVLSSETIIVKIEYTGSDRADGLFEVDFGSIALNYTSKVKTA